MRIVKTCISLILLFFSGYTSAQNNIDSSIDSSALKNLIVIQPTGKMINNLPEMVLITDTSQLYKKVYDIVNKSFVKDAVELYLLASTYLYNKNKLITIEPAYLALSKNDGGFAKVGFYLKTENALIKKENVPYIDIVEGRINGRYDKLMSITQLYPHEMGHVIYGMLNPDLGNKNSKSVDMHYFSVRTDYSTAFNEGFAEHIENIARIFEKNETIKRGVFADIEMVRLRSKIAINGFLKDYNYPFRLGYYKLSMPIWYQKYENLKRYEHVLNGNAKYLNSTLEVDNIEDRLTIRNAGIRQNKNALRNYVQMLSTEGVISSFFTQLTQSDAAEHFLDATFYKPFLSDTGVVINSPKDVFSSVQNQFLKYFTVFHEYMSIETTSGSEFVDFIDGYVRAFPSEELVIKEIFKKVTNLEYTNNLPPQIWLLVKNHSHRMIVPDPYGAITVPYYTFDLNASETEDLLTIEGLQKKEALRIIEYRKTKGFFNSINQIEEIEGISNQSVELILNSKYDEEFVQGLSIPELNLMKLLKATLKHLIFYTMTYFILVFGIIYFFFIRKEKLPIKRILSLSLIYLLQWIVFVSGGLIFVTLSGQPWCFLIFLSGFFLLMNLLVNRKSKGRRNRSVFATCLMSVVILFSLV